MFHLPYLLVSVATVVIGRKIGALIVRDDVSQCAINCIVQSGFSEGCTDLYAHAFCALLTTRILTNPPLTVRICNAYAQTDSSCRRRSHACRTNARRTTCRRHSSCTKMSAAPLRVSLSRVSRVFAPGADRVRVKMELYPRCLPRPGTRLWLVGAFPQCWPHPPLFQRRPLPIRRVTARRPLRLAGRFRPPLSRPPVHRRMHLLPLYRSRPQHLRRQMVLLSHFPPPSRKPVQPVHQTLPQLRRPQ